MKRGPKKRSHFTEFKHPVDDQIWRIEDFVSFKHTFEIPETELVPFVKVAVVQETPWLMARMRFGINPLIPPTNVDPEFLRSFTTAEVAQHFQTDEDQVNIQFEILQDAWHKFLKEGPDEPAAAAPVVAPEAQPTSGPEAEPEPPPKPPVIPSAYLQETPRAEFGDLPDDRKETIHRFGFAVSIFNVPGRSEVLRMQEVFWFTDRLIELQKMFDEPMAKNLARMAVMNEMQMRRADDEISQTPITSQHYWDTQNTKLKIEEIYQKQWSKLEEICPYIKSAASRQAVHGLISELIRAHQEFTINGNNALVDGLFTSYEIQVLMRQSLQQGAQYRPGWVMAVKEARDHLHDPNYKRKLPDKNFRLIDEAFREAMARMVEAGQVIPIDLEDKGPKGEYPPLIAPPEDGEVSVPDIDVPLEK